MNNKALSTVHVYCLRTYILPQWLGDKHVPLTCSTIYNYYYRMYSTYLLIKEIKKVYCIYLSFFSENV